MDDLIRAQTIRQAVMALESLVNAAEDAGLVFDLKVNRVEVTTPTDKSRRYRSTFYVAVSHQYIKVKSSGP